MRTIRAQLGLWVSLSLLVAALSAHFFPARAGGEIWISEKNPVSLQWDTGYGFNDVQKIAFTEPLTDATQIHGRTFYLLRSFRPVSQPDGFRIAEPATAPALEIYYGVGNHLTHAGPRKWEAGGSSFYGVEPLAWVSMPRTRWASCKFWFGVMALASLLSGLIGFAAKHARGAMLGDHRSRCMLLLFCAFGAALGLVFWLGWPGFQNPFDPVSILGFTAPEWGSYIFISPSYSPLLQFFWAGLFEVFPSYYLLNVAQVGWFFFAFLILAQGFWDQGWRSMRLFLLFAFVFLSPFSICEHLFLERSVVNGYVNCLLAVDTYLLASRRARVGWKGLLLFSFLFTLSGALRTDNLPFDLCLAAYLGFFIAPRLRPALAAILLASVLVNAVGVPRWVGAAPGWRVGYTVESTIHSLAAIVQENPKVLDKENRAAILDKAVNLEEIRDHLPFGSNHADRQSKDTGAIKVYLHTFFQMAWEMRGTFLKYRWNFIKNMASGAGVWGSHVLNSWNPELLDLRILPLASFKNPNALIGAERFPGLTANTFRSALEWGLILSLVFLQWTPAGLVIAIASLSRILIVYLLAPEPSAFYLYDVYLICCFLLLASGPRLNAIWLSLSSVYAKLTPSKARKHRS